MPRLYEVIGKKSYKSASSGKTGYTYYFAVDFKDSDKEAGECEGRATLQEFSYTDFPVIPGDKISLFYERGYQDKAMLADIQVMEPATAFKDKSSEGQKSKEGNK